VPRIRHPESSSSNAPWDLAVAVVDVTNLTTDLATVSGEDASKQYRISPATPLSVPSSIDPKEGEERRE